MGALPIEAEGLTRFYGARRGVIDLSFQVREGEIFAFLGPNGAGKTTTIRQLMGLLRPTSGVARVFGLDCWRNAPRVKAKVGFLPAYHPQQALEAGAVRGDEVAALLGIGLASSVLALAVFERRDVAP